MFVSVIHRMVCFLGLMFLLTSGSILAQGLVSDKEAMEGAFPERPYSPPAGRDFPMKVLWGDTHLHTAMSMDAGAFGARLKPEDAYRFARGEELISSTGLRVKLSRPLDFLVVADHSDNMGFFPRLFAGDPEFLADPTGRKGRGSGRGSHHRFFTGHFSTCFMVQSGRSGFPLCLG